MLHSFPCTLEINLDKGEKFLLSDVWNLFVGLHYHSGLWYHLSTFFVPVVCINDWFYTLRTFLTAVSYRVNKFLRLETDITDCVTITQCAYLATYQNSHLFCLTSSISGCSRKTTLSSSIIFTAEYGQCQRKGQNVPAGQGINSGNIFPSLYIPIVFVLLDDSPNIIPHQFHK